MRRFLLADLACGVIYCAALGSTDPVDLAIGMAVAAGVLHVGRHVIFNPHPDPAPPLTRRALAFLPWVLAVARDVGRGVLQVARASLHRRNLPAAGVVAIPLGERTVEGIGVSALTASLSPGEVLLSVDSERQVMYLHVLDASDPDAVRAAHAEAYERYQRKVLP